MTMPYVYCFFLFSLSPALLVMCLQYVCNVVWVAWCQDVVHLLVIVFSTPILYSWNMWDKKELELDRKWLTTVNIFSYFILKKLSWLVYQNVFHPISTASESHSLHLCSFCSSCTSREVEGLGSVLTNKQVRAGNMNAFFKLCHEGCSKPNTHLCSLLQEVLSAEKLYCNECGTQQHRKQSWVHYVAVFNRLYTVAQYSRTEKLHFFCCWLWIFLLHIGVCNSIGEI